MIPLERLGRLATGREDDIFAPDVEALRPVLAQRLAGARVLVVGGAGSIGASTLQEIVPFGPAALHVLDQNENGLAELVRDLRSGERPFDVADFRCFPLDFGSPIVERLLKEQPPYDFVLNFAAIKHVRSEKDVFSILQMLDTNVLKAARLLGLIARRGGTRRYFSVSTDKAANPVNLMGASKRIMEHATLSFPRGPSVTSARFANVAFSDGSLLEAWLRRIAKRQPLAVPRATKRYFVTLKEAGEICLLAAVVAPDRRIAIPSLDAGRDLRELQTIAELVVREHGYEPRFYDDGAEAKRSLAADVAAGRYPVLLTPLDTDGEKPYEEFVGEGETEEPFEGARALATVAYRTVGADRIQAFLASVEALLAEPAKPLAKRDVGALMASVVPELRHLETGATLDARM